MLTQISAATHKPLTEAALSLPKPYLREALEFPGFRECMDKTPATRDFFKQLELQQLAVQ